ncbi:hypothetical protein DSL64_25445 [Dyadobacter luteus]|uniref:HEAT repeat domain-containing protein n=2 Tax=Dyadobacter luteus TaxID=2259619 RepID=A0A3D8Y3X9_9BACT|nr:hypothetical protein DSL64_25445 [Dyadobacter luteus]
MNIREELLKYQVQSKAQAMQIATDAAGSEMVLGELIDCFTSGDTRLTQRAAWSLSWVAQKNPEAIQPYIDIIVSQISRPEAHDAVIRNSLRILEDIEIPEQFHGEVLNACFDFIQKKHTAVAIKAFSLHVIFNLSKLYPEIRNELKLVIQENIEFETAAFRSRGKKLLAKLK